jgi:hypothetical protein
MQWGFWTTGRAGDFQELVREGPDDDARERPIEASAFIRHLQGDHGD